MEIETGYNSTDGQIEHWALFSGGHDSLVVTHYLMENGFCDAVLHLDTRTGIQENQDFVIETCEEYGWPLRIEKAPITLKEWCLELGADDTEYGFPGPEFHSYIYRWLKEMQLGSIATETDGKPHYWTGVRKEESDRRMRTVTEPVEEVERWFWHAPIAEWSDEEMEEYLDDHDIARNPVVEAIHKSGECFCGAFDSRDETLIDLQANYPEHYEWIKELEEEIIEEIGSENERAYWAHGGLSDSDLSHLKSLREPEDMMLCRDCRNRNQNSASDTDW